MKPIYFLLLAVFFALSNPSENRHFAKLKMHLNDRYVEFSEDNCSQVLRQSMVYNDRFIFSTVYLDDVLISYGYLGKVIVLNEQSQRKVFKEKIIKGRSYSGPLNF